MRRWTLMAAIALAASGLVSGGYHEKRLLNDLLDAYNVLERPVGNESDPLQLSFGLTLMQIIDVDEKNQLLITNLWLKLEWNDVNMRWNISEYGGVRDLRIPPHRLWKPDVLMYNSADEGFDGTYPTNVVVKSNGTCLYVPPGIFKSTCKIDITWFPFDDQKCEMKFGSWTYDGFQLDLQLQDESGGDISSFITNGEWDLLGTYFNCIMFMVASSVVSTILILNYHHRNSDTHEMSDWVRIVFLDWLPCILRMSRPTDKEEKEAQKSQKPSPVTGPSKAYGDLELHQRSSKSLLANVLDLEDNALASHNNLLNNVYSTPGPHHHTIGHGHSHIHTTPRHHHTHTTATPHHQHSTPLPHSSYPTHQLGHTPHHHPHPQDGGAPQVETILQSACFCARYELVLILKEIKIITDQLKDEEVNTKVTNDWKFAAMVIDRMCLIIFTLFTIIATITVLFSAPHIIVT
ncbi:neuronal acetylcholine receptor subunit eat-2-like isoform X5 [Leptopilina boulardi]|uniref:neuronal acetylcholine receptor subunit eat-2-like isoform X5 n=1 Tax=Leptopilina boulardi TaxID=63433 RepID=UPI0021F67FD6|nr:neuronal acetylcholine receptor subunit eat-2-like isoform X5 [Leptopilina boulardi]